MKMKKMILTLAMITSLAMTGCGATETSDSESSVSSDVQVSQQEESVLSEDNKEEKTEPPKKTIEMSDNLSDFTFTLDGIVYSLPCGVSELLSDGWKIRESSGKESKEIKSDGYDSLALDKGDCSVGISIKNPSGNAKRISECQVETINLFSENSFVISKGIVNTSSYDEIISTYGEPTTITESDYQTIVEYEFDYHQTVTFIFQQNILKNVAMTNYIGKSEINSDDTSEEVPEYLSEYQQPSQLGDDAFSGNIELDGKLYNLPAPLSEFLDDGWDFDENNKPDAIKAKNKVTFFLKRDNEKLHVIVYNFADYQTIPENCAVAGISADNSNGISMVLPGGISFDSTKNDIESWLPDDFEKNEVNNTYFYSKTVYQDILENHDYVQRVSVSMPEDTGKVFGIEVEFVK